MQIDIKLLKMQYLQFVKPILVTELLLISIPKKR